MKKNVAVIQFKKAFRLFADDKWGAAMECWFECAGRMYVRGLDIPPEWNYRPGLDPINVDHYLHYEFKQASAKNLLIIGNFLHRYTKYLKHYGKDYLN